MHVRKKTIDRDQFMHPKILILMQKPAKSTNINREMFQLSSFSVRLSSQCFLLLSIWQFSVVTNVMFSSNAAIIFFLIYKGFTFKFSCGSGLLL